MPDVQPADAILAIDVGNTRIGIGLWDADGLHDVLRVPADQDANWRQSLRQTWELARGAQNRVVALGSVNGTNAARLSVLIEEVCAVEPLRVRDDLPLPMPLHIENAREVGVDRICCAAAAYERVQTGCAVASFGTATTIDCVSDEGEFLGGTILPGFDMSCDALHQCTAQLPRVQPALPENAFGKNTHDAIVGGVAYAMVGALREIVERFATDLGQWPTLIITGGNAELVHPLADFVDAVVPDLCLMGVALTYRRAAGEP